MAMPDTATLLLHSNHVGMKVLPMLRDVLTAIPPGKARQEYFHNMGIWLEGFQHAQARATEMNLGRGSWGGFMNNMSHVLTGMNAFDRGMRTAAARGAMKTLGEYTRTHSSLAAAEGESRFLRDAGINEDHWAVMRAAELDEKGLLTPQAIDNIPHDVMAKIVESKATARSEVLKAEVAKRDAQTAKEKEWYAKRADKLDAARDKSNRFLREFDERRQAGIDGHQEVADAHAELLRAHIERAEAEHDIAGYLRTQEAQGKIAEYLHRVEDGARQERVTPQAERTVENYGRGVNRSAEQLGARRARAEARIKEAQTRIDNMQKSHDAELARKAQVIQDRFAPQIKELNDYAAELNERAAKRKEIADAFQAKAGKVLDEEVRLARSQAREALLTVSYNFMQKGARGASRSTMWARYRSGLTNNAAGTPIGEALRFFHQFKSIVYGIFGGHMERMGNTSGVGAKLWYIAKAAAFLLPAGALATQLKALANGQNPHDMDPRTPEGRKFILESLAASGGLGLYGDLFVRGGETAFGTGLLEAAAGPGFSALNEIVKDVQTARAEANAGEMKHNYALDAVKFIRHNAAPFMNLWFLKAAFNRMVFDNIQDHLAPGSSAKQQQRTQARGGSYYWAPGPHSELHAPDLSKAFGEH
jgi:hypothetical protein